MSYMITNRTGVLVTVPIVIYGDAGEEEERPVLKRDEMFSQPSGQPILPEGWRVDQKFLDANPLIKEISLDVEDSAE